MHSFRDKYHYNTAGILLSQAIRLSNASNGIMVMVLIFRNVLLQLKHRAQNAKYYVQTCKKLQLLGLGTSSPDPYQKCASGPYWRTSDLPAPLTASTIKWQMSAFASVYSSVLVTPSAMLQTPGGTNRRHRFVDA